MVIEFFEQQSQEVKNQKNNNDLLELKVNFKGGSFEVYSKTNEEKSGVLFGYQNMKVKINLLSDSSKIVQFSLQNIQLDMLTSYSGLKKQIVTNVIRDNSLEKQFITVKYEEIMNQQKIKRIVNVMVNSPNIKYNPILIKRLKKIMDIKTSEELKMKAQDTYEETLQQQKEMIKNMKTENYEDIQYQVEVKAPIVILPFNSNDDNQNQCWVFQLGDLQLQNQSQNDYQHKLVIRLSNINMEYYSSVEYHY